MASAAAKEAAAKAVKETIAVAAATGGVGSEEQMLQVANMSEEEIALYRQEGHVPHIVT
eukprot:CAMPEP_0173118822 /NCGR_PEP_ID=MMETSP1102-20130122/51350_1 /TAXON_ID=49646 /ORGANISM="Geminigera sp., Strain Caron Lab Isolate" /LENGTH=58 /DNA_ID=CAMNT_0014024173 /DNA_START=29 /DNA_END=201 /DNA_ORIENTATION=+